MARLSSAEVFTPTSFPSHTYVEREYLHHERLLREWIRSSTQIASISGPSKSGKTVLVQRVVGEDNLVTVSGASVRATRSLRCASAYQESAASARPQRTGDL